MTKPSSIALQKAAQAWCGEKTSGTIMDSNLAVEFAKIIDNLIADTARLDKIQDLTEGFAEGWILRRSGFGRGMRLHETSIKGAVPDVRQAIDNYNPPSDE